MSRLTVVVLSWAGVLTGCVPYGGAEEVHPVVAIGPDVCEVDLTESPDFGDTKQSASVGLTGLGCESLADEGEAIVFSYAPDLPGHRIYREVIAQEEEGGCRLRFAFHIAVTKDGEDYPPEPRALTLALCAPHFDVPEPRGVDQLGGLLLSAKAGNTEAMTDLLSAPIPIGEWSGAGPDRCVLVPDAVVELGAFAFATEYEVFLPSSMTSRLYGADLHLRVAELSTVEAP